MRSIDVNPNYRNNLSSLNLCKFKEKFSHLDSYKREKRIKCNLFGGQLSVYSTIVANICLNTFFYHPHHSFWLSPQNKSIYILSQAYFFCCYKHFDFICVERKKRSPLRNIFVFGKQEKVKFQTRKISMFSEKRFILMSFAI